MRIRTVKPEFFKHEALYDAEVETGLPLRLAFVGLWCAADREGRFEWRPRRLKSDILPYDDTPFSRVLDALVTRGFVVRYSESGRDYACIPSFPRHQVINNRERESDLPAPTEAALEAALTRAPRVNHASPTRQGNAQAEREGEHGTRKGNMEGEGSISDANASLGENPPEPGELFTVPDCPYQKIKELYHTLCPSLRKVQKDTPSRHQAVRNRWRQYKGDLRAFEVLFAKAEASDFLAGRARPGKDRSRPFQADFDWLMKQENMLKTLEKKYDNA